MNAAERFDADEQAAAESLALEFAIQDAGGWHEYVALRDGENTRPDTRPRRAS